MASLKSAQRSQKSESSVPRTATVTRPCLSFTAIAANPDDQDSPFSVSGKRSITEKPFAFISSKSSEPFSALYEQGKVRHVGEHRQLEEELAGFSTYGYTGAKSPNRADALIFALAEIFPGMVKKPKPELELGKKFDLRQVVSETDGWMT